jgi:hypothetical protein
LHARGLVEVAHGRRDDAEAAFAAALEIVEPTMYTILAQEIRASLDSLHAGAAAAESS